MFRLPSSCLCYVFLLLLIPRFAVSSAHTRFSDSSFNSARVRTTNRQLKQHQLLCACVFCFVLVLTWFVLTIFHCRLSHSGARMRQTWMQSFAGAERRNGLISSQTGIWIRFGVDGSLHNILSIAWQAREDVLSVVSILFHPFLRSIPCLFTGDNIRPSENRTNKGNDERTSSDKMEKVDNDNLHMKRQTEKYDSKWKSRWAKTNFFWRHFYFWIRSRENASKKIENENLFPLLDIRFTSMRSIRFSFGSFQFLRFFSALLMYATVHKSKLQTNCVNATRMCHSVCMFFTFQFVSTSPSGEKYLTSHVLSHFQSFDWCSLAKVRWGKRETLKIREINEKSVIKRQQQWYTKMPTMFVLIMSSIHKNKNLTVIGFPSRRLHFAFVLFFVCDGKFCCRLSECISVVPTDSMCALCVCISGRSPYGDDLFNFNFTNWTRNNAVSSWKRTQTSCTYTHMKTQSTALRCELIEMCRWRM